jgi:hypothetical protein
MPLFPRAPIFAFLGVLAYHLVTAILARILGLSHHAAEIVSELGVIAICFGAGFVTARASQVGSLGIVAALGAGLAHGTFGWRLSAAIRGGWLPGGADYNGAELAFAMEWLIYGGILGFAGAAAASLIKSRRVRPGS